MGMFDTMEGLDQVKCFNNNLVYYNIGDEVPCSENNYPKDIVIIDSHLENPDIYRWEEGCVAVIKGSVFKECIPVKDFVKDKNILKDIQVIDGYGRRLKIKSANDLFSFIKDKLNFVHERKMLRLDYDARCFLENINFYDIAEEFYEKSDLLSEDFHEKWYIDIYRR